ncbi:MAG: histidine phosphatase family protein [Candidatus Sifarchaeia archaeon]
MGNAETWDTEEWLNSAKQILKWISSIEPEQPVMLLVRHSHRETLQNHEEMVSGGLTDIGKKMSFEMGKRIPRKGKMHIFTSFVPRCFETAEGIAEGFTEKGGEVIDIDPLPALVGPQVIDRDVWSNLHPDGKNVIDFVNGWVDGRFGERMEPFNDYQDRLMANTVERVIKERKKIIYVHVTHDLAMMCAKRIILKRPLLEKDREPFLGGLGLTLTKSGALIFVGGKELPISTG